MVISRIQSISIALRRCRRAVIVCCWLVGLALAAQTTIWSLAMFTDLRYEQAAPTTAAPTIVKSEEAPKRPVRAVTGSQAETVVEATEMLQNQKRLSLYEERFATVVAFAGTVGTMALLALIPLLMTGVLLAAGAAVPGVQKVVSALTWFAIVALLALPISSLFPLVQYDGAFYSYGDIIAGVEANRGGESLTGAPVFILRYLALPLMCVVGLVMLGIRFAGGVEAAMVPHEMALDPALEQEVSRIKSTSLHAAGRSAAALRGAVSKDVPPLAATSSPGAPASAAAGTSSSMPTIPRATQVSQGAAPKRLI